MSRITDAADAFQIVLTRLADDRRNTIPVYGNVTEHAGSAVTPRRVISNVGFSTQVQVNYLDPDPAHIEVAAEPRTTITQIILQPYGLLDDRRLLVATRPADRRVLTAGSAEQGVAPLEGLPQVVVPAVLDIETASAGKTARVLQSMSSPLAGPAYHFIITRRGDLTVCASLDDVVYATRDYSETCINVAMEGAVGILRTDWDRRYYSSLIELPFTLLQLSTLAVLISKIRTAIPAIPSTFIEGLPSTSTSGIAYVFPTDVAGLTRANFLVTPPTTSPVSHETSKVSTFIADVENAPPTDLSTQVFRSERVVTPHVTRALVQPLVGTFDTAGTSTPVLAGYVPIAAADRATEMEQTPRSEMFVERINSANRDADAAGSHGQAIGASATQTSPRPATLVDPHVYNFATGFWGDGKTY